MSRKEKDSPVVENITMKENNGQLNETDVHDILSNHRRQLTLEYLAKNGNEMSIRELSEKIAEDHTNEAPPPRDVRASVYSSLHQTHLPKLDEMNVVNYDKDSKITKLDKGFDQVRVYTEVVTPYGITWSQYYVMLGVLSQLVIIGSEIGVPILARVGTHTWSMILLTLILLSVLYQILTNKGYLYRKIYSLLS